MRTKQATSGKIEQAFEKAGVRATSQRYFVLEYLLNHPQHPTVEELWAAVNKKHALASRATVYNTLHTLVNAGLVHEFTLDGKAARYDANLERHHHFICDKCGAMEDVDWFALPALNRTRVPARRIRSFEVILRGVCTECL